VFVFINGYFGEIFSCEDWAAYARGEEIYRFVGIPKAEAQRLLLRSAEGQQ
jgi:hypothetical protein